MIAFALVLSLLIDFCYAQRISDVLQFQDLAGPWQRNVSEKCGQDVQHYLDARDNGTTWAVKMSDASGRYGSQFLFGNYYWLGSYTFCQQLPDAAYTVVSLRVNATGLVRDVFLGVCLPASCDSIDVIKLVHFTSPPAVLVLAARTVPDPQFSIWREPGLFILIVVIGVMTLLVGVSTGYDLIVQHRKSKSPGSIECNGNHLSYTATGPADCSKPDIGKNSKDEKGLLVKCLLCFSAWSNLQKICDTRSEDALACIHGMRVFSLLWVIAGHTCMFTFPISDNKGFRQLVEQDFLFQSISNGAFSVDTFFFLSGVMVSYLFFKNSNKIASSQKEQQEEGTITLLKNNALRFVGVFSYRYLRLTPPYLFILAVTQLNSRWFYHNAVMHNPFMVRDQATCPEYWWRNVLYINTLFPVKDMCMIWSWYLANDTQFYTLGIILLLLSAKHFKLAVTSLFVFLISSWFTTAVIVLNTHHVPSIEEPLGLFDELYDKPWTRLGPYVIGMCAGWILFKTNCSIKMHKAVVITGWALSIGMTFILVHGLYGDLGPIMSASYVALSHTAWAIAVAWIVIACSTGNGGYVNRLLSCKFLYPLSRISYCAYLVHPLVMISVIMHLDSPMHLGRTSMIIVIFGYFCTSYMLSLVVSLGFEAPTIALLNILHPIKRKFK